MSTKEHDTLRNIKFLFSSGVLAFLVTIFGALKYIHDVSNTYENDLLAIKKDMEFSRNALDVKVSSLQEKINDMRIETTKANESQDKVMIMWQSALNERLSKIESQQQKTQEMILEIHKMMRSQAN